MTKQKKNGKKYIYQQKNLEITPEIFHAITYNTQNFIMNY